MGCHRYTVSVTLSDVKGAREKGLSWPPAGAWMCLSRRHLTREQEVPCPPVLRGHSLVQGREDGVARHPGVSA